MLEYLLLSPLMTAKERTMALIQIVEPDQAHATNMIGSSILMKTFKMDQAC